MTLLTPRPEALLQHVQRGCARIAPLWPLQDFVAVNPFLGFTGQTVGKTSHWLGQVTGAQMFMPAPHYSAELARGRITEKHLQQAIELDAVKTGRRKVAPAVVQAALAGLPENVTLLETFAEVADRVQGTDTSENMDRMLADWCAGYFDQGQALWPLPWKNLPLFEAWKASIRHDPHPELLGIAGFRRHVLQLPDQPTEVVLRVLQNLQLPMEMVEALVYRLLSKLGGWAGHVRYQDWDRELQGQPAEGLIQLLAIRLSFESALHAATTDSQVRKAWQHNVQRWMGVQSESPAPDPRELVQLACEVAHQQDLMGRLLQGGDTQPAMRPSVQAVFCIDVRSEVYRRALEEVQPRAETLGFAGFFGMALEHLPLGGQHSRQCPVLLQPRIRVVDHLKAGVPGAEQKLASRMLQNKTTALWKKFKTSAVSSFAHVEAAGVLAGFRLVQDTLGLRSEAQGPATLPHLDLPVAEKVNLASSMLRGMSLTAGFARLVVLVGHGSTSANNPHAAGLDCGACGGHSGEINARAGAALLNEPEVRAGLAQQGISVPADTWFVGALHNTTTDDVGLFDLDLLPASHGADLDTLQQDLQAASEKARLERAQGLGLSNRTADVRAQMVQRSKDWSEVRPEWGLAGNSAFIAAPRARTRGVNLQGRSFLHSYDWTADHEFQVLELILTAPVVVASWINLQYYGSTVDNLHHGSGNKTLHNVVGGSVGVLLGSGGDLQVGLPLQSLHDGENWVHEPLRLSVFVEAPREAINRILQKHQHVRDLVDHGWLHLFRMEEGRFERCLGNLQWQTEQVALQA